MKLIRFSVSTVILAGAALAATAGCDKDKSSDVRPGSADEVTRGRGNADGPDRTAASQNRSAVESITGARCDREQRCNNIGSGKRFESRSVCVTTVRSDWQGELSALECPRGIEQNKLDTCLDRLRTDGCANPVESLGRVAACRQAEICRAS